MQNINIFLRNWGRCAFCGELFYALSGYQFYILQNELAGSLCPGVKRAMWPSAHIDWQHLALLDWAWYKRQINPFHCSSLLPNGGNHPAMPFISCLRRSFFRWLGHTVWIMFFHFCIWFRQLPRVAADWDSIPGDRDAGWGGPGLCSQGVHSLLSNQAKYINHFHGVIHFSL